MARIAGIDIPRDKRLEVSLTYIYGIGRTTAIRICEDNGLDLNARVSSLTEEEVNKIRSWVDANLTIEGDLRRDVQNDIKRKIEIGCHQGIGIKENNYIYKIVEEFLDNYKYYNF